MPGLGIGSRVGLRQAGFDKLSHRESFDKLSHRESFDKLSHRESFDRLSYRGASTGSATGETVPEPETGP